MVNILGPELLQIADSAAREKGIDRDEVIVAVEQAIQRAGRSKYGLEHDIRASIDRKTGEIRLARYREVVEEDAEIEDEFAQLKLSHAQRYNAAAKVGDMMIDDLPPVDFGRVAAQSAKQVIVQKVREAERARQYREFVGRVGEIVNGLVKRNEFGHVVVDLGQAEAVLRIPWSEDPATFIVNALAPAEVVKVVLDEEDGRIEVVVPDDQLSQAIGRRGQNVRLASQLTGWSIDILTEAEESERRQEEMRQRSALFIDALDVDEVIAQLLVNEGFTTLEEVAYIGIEDLMEIEGFEEEIAEELQRRAQDYLEQLAGATRRRTHRTWRYGRACRTRRPDRPDRRGAGTCRHIDAG